jgi:hypothetical protein
MGASGRTRPDVLAHTRFLARKAELEGLPQQQLFTRIWQTNLWGAETSASGLGSEDAATATLRRELPKLFRQLEIETLLDLPCGDFGWMNHTELGLREYLGGDIVAELVADNVRRYATADGRVSFAHLDLLTDRLPAMDAILCRDCLVHLSLANISRALAQFRASGSRFLIATTFIGHDGNEDAADGDWRMLNLLLPPFDFPPPLAIINEDCTEGGGAYADKSLGVWKLDALARR